MRTLDLNVRDFVIYDFRRTASTLLHEQGYNSDWVEKCPAHKIGGVRGIYNRAEYLNQRREMLQSRLILLMRRLRLEGRLPLDNSGSLTM